MSALPDHQAFAAALTYGRAGPRADRNALARKHMPLVRRIAWHVHGSMANTIEVEDLVQIGLVALIEAESSFEDRGVVPFEQYLATRVRGSMIDALRRQATLTRGAMRRRKQYGQAVAGLTALTGTPPEDRAIAEKLGVTLEKLRSDYATAEPVRFETIDDVYADTLPCYASEEPDAFEQLAQADLRQALIAAIAALPEREALVVQLYYVEELNLEEIGQVLGVGQARVSQIKSAAHARLKKALSGAR